MTIARHYRIRIGRQPESNYAQDHAIFRACTSVSVPQARSFPALPYGLRELRWFESRPAILSNFRNQWIAIKDDGVLASATTPLELRDQLRNRGIQDAFLIHVPADLGKWDNLIA